MRDPNTSTKCCCDYDEKRPTTFYWSQMISANYLSFSTTICDCSMAGDIGLYVWRHRSICSTNCFTFLLSPWIALTSSSFQDDCKETHSWLQIHFMLCLEQIRTWSNLIPSSSLSSMSPNNVWPNPMLCPVCYENAGRMRDWNVAVSLRQRSPNFFVRRPHMLLHDSSRAGILT